MLTKGIYKVMKLNDGDKYLGIIRYNDEIIRSGRFVRPFVRVVNPLQIIIMGNRDYHKLDQFIIAALNDYYKKISASSETERSMMLKNYNHLYQLWTLLNQAKNNYNYKMMNQHYDALSYQLYLLGYKVSNF